MEHPPCCSPRRDEDSDAADPAPLPAANPSDLAGPGPLAIDWIEVGGATFSMGDDSETSYPADGEGPVRSVTLSPFSISAAPVTNTQFAEFVDATGRQTEAEHFGWSFVFGGLLPDDFPDTRAVAAAPWWRQVYGADWRQPEGPHSDLTDRADHPVSHVSFNDATAYAEWAGARLPTEAEWECAARAGTTTTFPWGDDLEPEGNHLANVWQGSFPDSNSLDDGWLGTSPVGTYPPNDYGLIDAIGNVWEWTTDWFTDSHDLSVTALTDPTGPSEGTHRVMKGGSYLCHESYCRRYRSAARLSNTPDSSAGNVGFRIAR